MAKTADGRPKAVLGACGWVLIVLAVGCGNRPSPSPTAPGAQSPAAYRIEGAVLDKLARPLADAVVTILDGPLAGTSTRTKEAGKFEFGVHSPGLTTLRASRDGFVSQTQRVAAVPIPGAVVGMSFFLRPSSRRSVSNPGHTRGGGRRPRDGTRWQERPTLRALASRLSSRRAAIERRSRRRRGRRRSTPTP